MDFSISEPFTDLSFPIPPLMKMKLKPLYLLTWITSLFSPLSAIKYRSQRSKVQKRRAFKICLKYLW